MPGSTSVLPLTASEKVVLKSQQDMMDTQQPPPVAPRTTSISLQPWQPETAPEEESYTGDRCARSTSTDSLESSGSSSSGGGGVNNRITDVASEYIPTRTIGKAPKLPSHNPLQFVKVQSPLYIKAEQQIKLTKEIKITREALKEGEEEWQSNLDNWKSRRRKVSEKVIQRAEEMRRIEIEEKSRQEKILQQQKKIKKFSEIVENKSTRSYNLDLYIGQGDDSGLGGTPEPDDILKSQSSIVQSDTSEGMTSEAESVDCDIQKLNKICIKDPPKVPQKPYCRLKKTASVSYNNSETNTSDLFQHCLTKQESLISDNNSSTDPSDIEGHAGDTEATSSEEDAIFSGQLGNIDSGLERSYNNRGGLVDSASDLSQDSNNGLQKCCEEQHVDLSIDETIGGKRTDGFVQKKITDGTYKSFKICIRHGENKGFGFILKGGKDQGCPAYVENVIKGGPAEETGLKVGDKIISLNGEYTVDYSHASLIFSIKQATYTGILDMVISRAENFDVINSEMKTKEASKGNSFAAKIALFSTGINIPATNLEESKSNAKLTEAKHESLVLRRCSAFENGKTENALCNNIVNRRLSCISQATNISNEKKLERRHSVDFTLSSNATNENNLGRKGPPPPVPVKPKIKSKAALFEANKSPVNKVNNFSESILSLPDSIKNDSENLSSESQSVHQSLSETLNVLENDESPLSSQKDNYANQDNKQVKTDEMNAVFNLLSEGTSPSHHINQIIENITYHEDQIIVNSDSERHTLTNIEVNDDKFVIQDNVDVKLKKNDNSNSDNSNEMETIFESKSEIPDSICDKFEQLEFKISDTFANDLYELELDVRTCAEKIYKDLKVEPRKTTSIDFHEQSTADCVTDYVNDIILDNCTEDAILEVSEESSLITSASCHLTCDVDNINDSVKDVKDIEVTDLSELSETKKTQKNSPLCLSLEKIDEDDVISASTTTSSDTPDTETVIETLPSNFSPLPNDESNGENSSKHLIYHDEEYGQELDTIPAIQESSYVTSENGTQNHLENENIDINESKTTEDASTHTYDAFVNTNDNIIAEPFYDDQQEDEYARELDESLDQITSLDIIDRIEQSLMDQLQKDNAYEDIVPTVNSELENDSNNPWLYFSEESEFLDDLTPRNLEPPTEPPPPPPLPEMENQENKAMSLGRCNSTKRIKKELWRRRSDFLGIDSSEIIDIDNIPPPPPGLEELLKQEREQTQRLEKQLSLPEPDAEILYPAESTYIDLENYNTNNYSEYYIEEDRESSKEIVNNSEQWGENTGEEALYENTYESQYESVPVIPTIVDESSTKICESPQHKAKQNIQNLGAAPKAKIMDSTKWITEKVETISKKSVEPVFRQVSYNQNYWLTQDGERRRSMHFADNHSDERYSMSAVYSKTHPDVTVRTWSDREYEYQQHQPRSALYDRSTNKANFYGQYASIEKKDLQQTQSLDSQSEVNFETDTIESEVHMCSCCGKGLCEGSAMGIEALQLYFHIECFRCCVCFMQLGNGLCGTDVQVKDNQLYCPACFTVD